MGRIPLWKETEKVRTQRIVNTHRSLLAFHGKIICGEKVIDCKVTVGKKDVLTVLPIIFHNFVGDCAFFFFWVM